MPSIETERDRGDVPETGGRVTDTSETESLSRPEGSERGGLWRDIASRPAAVTERLAQIASTLARTAEEIGRDVLEASRPAGDLLIEPLVEPQSDVTHPEGVADQERGFDPEVWISGAEVESSGFVTERDIAERFRELNLPEYVAYLLETDDRLGQQMEIIRRLMESDSTQDRQKAVAELRRNVAGRIAELIVRDALAPYFEKVEEQVPVQLPDGRSTMVDLRFESAIQSIRFGRDGLVEPGGDLSVEVKVGAPTYLASQLSHIGTQVSGHGDTMSIVVVSKDVHVVQSDDLREPLKDMGSPVWAFLPGKVELDQLLMDMAKPTGVSS